MLVGDASSLDAVSDRDFLLEYVSDLAIISMHCSRIAEQWVLWTSEEFKFMIAGDSVRARALSAACRVQGLGFEPKP